MKIIVDAFGGDNAPLEVIKGSRNAKDDLGVDIVLVGDKEKIFSCAAQNKISLTGIDIIDAPDVIAMTDQPGEILKSKKNCSMAVGLQALADGKGDAFVSAGSTGALVMGATFIVKRIKGVKRPAIGSVLPSNDKPFLLLDCGANADCTAEHLKQFAQMGAIYSEKFVKVQSPRVLLRISAPRTARVTACAMRRSICSRIRKTSTSSVMSRLATCPTAAAMCSSRTASRATLS